MDRCVMHRLFSLAAAPVAVAAILPVGPLAAVALGEFTYPGRLTIVNPEPQCVVVEDIDGDGHLDYAVNFRVGFSVSVYMGDGAGGFEIGSAILIQPPSPGTTESFVFADVDLDGDPDCIVAGFQGVHVMRNGGGGVYLTGASTGHYEIPGSTPSGVAAGDINGDGFPDLAVADRVADSVSIRLNNGDGTFGAPTFDAVGDTPVFIAAADLDGVNGMDFVVANEVAGTVHVLLSNGDGTMAPPVAYAVGPYPRSVALGDINGDLLPDVVISNFDSTVTIRLNTGAGVLGAASTIAGVGNAHVVLADLDSDGDLDVLTSGGLSMCAAILNDGSGSFGAPVQSIIGRNYYGVGDFDGDGVPDVASIYSTGAGGSTPASVMVSRGLGDGVFRGADSYATTSASRLARADLDGDGDPDIVAFTGAGVATLENMGGGVFAASVEYAVTNNLDGDIAVGDFDGDGDVDVAIVTRPSDLLILFRNDGDGVLAPDAGVATGEFPAGMAVGDVDGDGDLDVVVVNRVSDDLMVYANNGDGTFAAPVTHATTNNPRDVVLADIDADGDIDILYVGDAPGIWLRLNDGAGGFATSTQITDANQRSDIYVRDLDNDGDLDIITSRDGTKNMSVRRNNGDGTFANVLRTAYANVSHVDFADVDEDGDLDAILMASGAVGLCLNNGSASFQFETNVVRFGVGPGGHLFVDDLSGNGLPDIAVAAGSVNILLAELVPPPPCPGDIDGSGAVDAADFVILAGSFGTAVPPGTAGDLNGDGLVNAADFVILAANYGSSCP